MFFAREQVGASHQKSGESLFSPGHSVRLNNMCFPAKAVTHITTQCEVTHLRLADGLRTWQSYEQYESAYIALFDALRACDWMI
jgi:hypothetical protein